MNNNFRIRGKKFSNLQFFEELLFVKRVSKTTTGGRSSSFAVYVAIGSKTGYFGIGYGKATELTSAKQKAVSNAKSNLYFCNMHDSRTILHEVTGKFSSSKILVRPSSSGSGIKANKTLRTIFDLIGMKDIICKSIGSNNPVNLIRCLINALGYLNSEKYYNEIKSELWS